MLYLLMFAVGLGLSAFFSGTETGFYRVAKVRLVMDARSGGWIAKALLWLASHTGLIVATVLIGNNLANSLISLSLVLLSSQMLPESARLQSLVPVVMTPFVFVYGELMPKLLFFQMPYRLLRLGAPLMLICSVLFLPVSILVLGYEWLWSWVTNRSNSNIGYALGKQEIQRALKESQAAGVVIPLQRDLAENLFSVGGYSIRQFAIPLKAIPMVTTDATPAQAINAASKLNSTLVGIQKDQRLVGWCLAAEIQMQSANTKLPIRPICEVNATDTCIQVLTQMQAVHAPLAQVVTSAGRALGVVTQRRMLSLMLAD